MNEFSLPDSVLFSVLSALDDRHLVVSCRGVSHTWQELTDLVLLERFLDRWGVAELVGSPPAPTCLVATKLSNFCWRHAVVKTDTLARIAVKFGTDVPALKRYNNILSDHTLMARDNIYIPVGGLEEVKMQRVAFTHCSHAKRRFLVVLRDGEELPQPAGRCASHARALEQLTLMLQRGLRVDESTARYYMAQAGGNVRAAMAAIEDDNRWERVMRRTRAR